MSDLTRNTWRNFAKFAREQDKNPLPNTSMQNLMSKITPEQAYYISQQEVQALRSRIQKLESHLAKSEAQVAVLAVLREALEKIRDNSASDQSYWFIIANTALRSNTAGSDLLERVQKLEKVVEAVREMLKEDEGMVSDDKPGYEGIKGAIEALDEGK